MLIITLVCFYADHNLGVESSGVYTDHNPGVELHGVYGNHYPGIESPGIYGNPNPGVESPGIYAESVVPRWLTLNLTGSRITMAAHLWPCL